jgi:hypothetical protein
MLSIPKIFLWVKKQGAVRKCSLVMDGTTPTGIDISDFSIMSTDNLSIECVARFPGPIIGPYLYWFASERK